MQLGESLLAIGAMVMFTVGTLQLNAARLDSRVRMWEAECRTTALGLAHSYIEQAQMLSFDEVVVDSLVLESRPEGLTAPDLLGPDLLESDIDSFDDLDDFHGFTDTVVTSRGRYRVHFETSYADSATLAPVQQLSLLKWLTVAVTSPQFRDTLRVHYLHALR